MGIASKRIERDIIIRNAADRNLPVEIRRGNLRLPCAFDLSEGLLSKTSLRFMTTAPVDLIHKGDAVRIFLVYFGMGMMFESEILDVEPDILTVSYPELIYRKLERKYERIKPPDNVGIGLSYTSGETNLPFPVLDIPSREPGLPSTREFSIGNLSRLIADYRDRAKSQVSENNIILFRDRGPSGFEERIMARTGKGLVVHSYASGYPDDSPPLGMEFLTRRELVELVKTGSDTEDSAKQQLKEITRKKLAQSIYAEFYCPIKHQKYLIGYVNLKNTNKLDYFFNDNFLAYTVRFVEAFAYALNLSGYFLQGTQKKSITNLQIQDMSLSGALVYTDDRELASHVMVFSEINVMVLVPGAKISVPGRIVRKNASGSGYNIGIRFLGMKYEDTVMLHNFLYNRSFEDDETEFEGGIHLPSE